jgi:molybdopterin-guanine dinucleotide biosynthesis protein A
MFNAIVLAGEREKALQNSELLTYANAQLKSLILIKNKPMIMYVLDTLIDHPMINKIFVIGPAILIENCPDLQQLVNTEKIIFKEQLKSPVNSILSVINEIDESEKIFITTSDNVLIKKEWIDFFLSSSLNRDKDIAMGVNDYKSVISKFPESKRTVLKFRDISFCFCNLFAINNIQGRKLIEMWKKVENLRKKPFKIATMLMPVWGLILFACGLLTSKKGEKMMSKRLNTNIGFIVLPYPEACIDVDKVEDLILVKKILDA